MNKYKKIKFILTLRNKKISSLSQLRENCTFEDIDELCKVHQNGTLRRWLNVHKYFELVSEIDKLSTEKTSDINFSNEELDKLIKLVGILDIKKAILNDYKFQKYQVFFEAGNKALYRGKYEEAIANYNNAVIFNLSKSVFYNRGDAYYNLEQYKEAIANYTKAIELSYKYDVPKCNVLFLVGDFAKFPLLRKRIEEEFCREVDRIVIPDYPDAAILLGSIVSGNLKTTKYKLFIAIHFGTARLGYAYQFMADDRSERPIFRIKWPDTNEDSLYVPTAILLAPDGSVTAWGHTAKKRFAQLTERAEEQGYIFIDNFKTLLHEGQDRDEDGPYIIKEERKFYVLHLIAEFLSQIKKVALEDIAVVLGDEDLLEENKILWCLTVPAVWGEDSKKLMRHAAQMAGLIREGTEEAERLFLVSEPQAAALNCQQIMLERKLAPLLKGNVLMIVDAGDKIVNITVHELLMNNKLEELVPSDGGLHGFKYVDKRFREFLNHKLSDEAMTVFQTEYPIQYIQLINTELKSIKCSYDADDKWMRSISLPRRLDKILEEKYPDILEKLACNQNGDDTVIWLTSQDMEEIFKPTIDLLLAKVRKQYTALIRMYAYRNIFN